MNEILSRLFTLQASGYEPGDAGVSGPGDDDGFGPGEAIGSALGDAGAEDSLRTATPSTRSAGR